MSYPTLSVLEVKLDLAASRLYQRFSHHTLIKAPFSSPLAAVFLCVYIALVTASKHRRLSL